MVGRPAGAGAPLVLGLVTGGGGAANLAAWAVLPSLGNTAASYARYTMSIKLAFGVAGVLMTTWLRERVAFATADFMALACLPAAWLIWPRRRRDGPTDRVGGAAVSEIIGSPP